MELFWIARIVVFQAKILSFAFSRVMRKKTKVVARICDNNVRTFHNATIRSRFALVVFQEKRVGVPE